MRRLLILLLMTTALVALGGSAPASAHPLGNATVNHYDALTLSQDELVDEAVADIAEIPTFQRRSRIDADRDGTLSAAERSAYATSQCAAMASAVTASVDGTRVPLTVTRSSYEEKLGQVSLQVGRLECRLVGSWDLRVARTLSFENTWDDDGIGWHEITAVGTDVSLQRSPFPSRSVSDALRSYPNDLLSSPLDVRRGSVLVVPGGGSSTYDAVKDLPVAGPVARALNRVSNEFNSVAGREHLTVGVGLLAVLLSLVLGAGHAFLPGHGKTIMAAYLVGRRGRLRDVLTVGATVTITHTAGVLVLGLLLTTTSAFAPASAERLLGVVSGGIVAAVGLGLLWSAVRGRRTSLAAALDGGHAHGPDGHTHGPEDAASEGGHVHVVEPALVGTHTHEDGTVHEDHHDHGHGDGAGAHAHGHGHGHGHGDGAGAGASAGGHGHSHGHSHGHAHGHSHGHAHGFGRSGLVGLGIAGGLVPSPSALLVLLAATALGRTVFGVVLVLGYGLGMALALCLAGLLLVRLRGRLDRWSGSRAVVRADRLLAVLPALTALLVIAVGTGLALRALGGSV